MANLSHPVNTRLEPKAVARAVFWPAAGVVLLFAAFAIIAPDTAESLFLSIQENVVNWFSWYYVLIAAFFVGFCLYLGYSKYGDIKLGNDDDKPEFSNMSWLALLFAAGMGIGLVFYGVSEPLSHYSSPRPGVTGTSEELAQYALRQTYLHWGFSAWAIYVVIGLALAYAIHRRKRPISIRWALEPVLGRKRVEGGWGHAIDIVALVGTIFGVATSLGLGVMQIASGLEAVGIAQASTGLEIGLIAIITCFVIYSVVSGVTKGMKYLSNTNLVLAALIMIFILVTGPTLFLLRDFVQSIGNYIQTFVGQAFTVSAFAGEAGEAWQGAWTTFYWGWWMSWAPFVGVFIARVSRGRTVREFVTGVLLVPTTLTFLWFAILGGSGIYMQLTGKAQLVNPDGSVDVEASLFNMLEHLPGTAIVTVGVIILIAIFFVTSADSGALVMAMIASGGQEDPRRWLKVSFACMSSVLAIALLLAGGLNALKTAAILIALPFSIVMLLICWSTVTAFAREIRAYQRAQRATFREHIGEYYGLEVEGPAEEGAHLPKLRLPQRLRRPSYEGAQAVATPMQSVPSGSPVLLADAFGPAPTSDSVPVFPHVKVSPKSPVSAGSASSAVSASSGETLTRRALREREENLREQSMIVGGNNTADAALLSDIAAAETTQSLFDDEHSPSSTTATSVEEVADDTLDGSPHTDTEVVETNASEEVVDSPLEDTLDSTPFIEARGASDAANDPSAGSAAEAEDSSESS